MRVALAVALLALALGVPGAGAQSTLPGSPGVGLDLDARDLRVPAGNQSVVHANVTNAGTLPASLTLDVAAPEGWTVSVNPGGSIAIAAGQTQQITISILAPQAASGAPTGALLVAATLTEQSTGRAASAEAQATLARVDPLPPPPPPGWTPEGLALLAFGTLAIVGGIVLAERARRKRLAEEAARVAAEEAREAAERAAWLDRETGVTLALEGPLMPWGIRRELLQRVRVANASARDRVAHVGVRSATPGWIASVSLPRVPLAPGEGVTLTLYLNPSDEVPGGAPAEVVLYAKPAEAQEREERVTLSFDPPPIRVPTRADASTVAMREGAPRPRLRL